MALSCSGKLLRILLIVFNLLIFVTGGIMTGFGIYLVVEANVFNMTGALMTMVVAFLVIGCLVLVTGFLGCCGAWKKSKCLLRLFTTILVLIIMAEIVSGVILIVYKDNFKPFIKDFFIRAIAEIGSNPNSIFEDTIREMQTSFGCCGANGPSDWQDPGKYCCKPGEKCNAATFPGCVEKISYELKGYSIGIGAGVVVLAIIEIGAIFAALILAKQTD
nr:tetraspanin [Hymenolepis microstoma]